MRLWCIMNTNRFTLNTFIPQIQIWNKWHITDYNLDSKQPYQPEPFSVIRPLNILDLWLSGIGTEYSCQFLRNCLYRYRPKSAPCCKLSDVCCKIFGQSLHFWDPSGQWLNKILELITVIVQTFAPFLQSTLNCTIKTVSVEEVASVVVYILLLTLGDVHVCPEKDKQYMYVLHNY